MRRLRAAAAALALALASAAAEAAPARVLSMNLCTDQLVLALLPPARIAGVSWLTRDCATSPMCAAAAAVPAVYGTAEEMIAARPDLVVAGRWTTRAAVGIARRLGFAVLELPAPTTLDAVRRQMRELAETLGEPARGESLVAALDAGLAAVPSPAGAQPVAAIYQPNGMTVGANSLADAVLHAAGFDNLARRLAIENYPHVPLEMLIESRPDLLVLGERRETRPSLADAVLRHPALAHAFGAAHRLVLPQRLWQCAGPWLADAVRVLADARSRLPVR